MPESSPGRDVNVCAIAIGGIGIACGIAFALSGAYWLLRERGPAANTVPHAFKAPAPLLQTAPQIERAAYFAEKEGLAGSYGWIDRQAGIARIPVDTAMAVLAARAGKPVHGAVRAAAHAPKEAP
jgi:hypothetical protein